MGAASRHTTTATCRSSRTDRCVGVVSLARPHGRGPHPARRRDQRRRAARASRVSSWPRRRSATCGAGRASTTTASTRRSSSPSSRSLEDVWHLLFGGELPDAGDLGRVRRRGARAPRPAGGSGRLLPQLADGRAPRRAAHGRLAARRRARLAAHARHRRRGAGRPGPAALRRRPDDPGCGPPARPGHEPVEPQPDLGFAANYLFMLTGAEPSERTPGRSSST